MRNYFAEHAIVRAQETDPRIPGYARYRVSILLLSMKTVFPLAYRCLTYRGSSSDKIAATIAHAAGTMARGNYKTEQCHDVRYAASVPSEMCLIIKHYFLISSK